MRLGETHYLTPWPALPSSRCVVPASLDIEQQMPQDRNHHTPTPSAASLPPAAEASVRGSWQEGANVDMTELVYGCWLELQAQQGVRLTRIERHDLLEHLQRCLAAAETAKALDEASRDWWDQLTLWDDTP